MGNTYPIGNFTVTKSQPATEFDGTTTSGIVRFTITDSANLLTTTRMIRAVLCDAIDQWLAIERADLDTNGDTDVLGSTENLQGMGVGDGFSQFSFKYGDKAAEVVLTALTSISTTGTITAAIPYADVI